MPTINLRQRDLDTLRLLSWTQASAALILKANDTFRLTEHEEPYHDERRVRERLQVLERAGLARAAPIAMPTGGLANWYRLTVEGYRAVYGTEQPLPPTAFFGPIKVSRQEHTMRLADTIIHTLVASHRHGIRIAEYRRENELEITGVGPVQYPDSFFRFHRSGREFNVMLELDNGTEPLDSHEPHSIRKKILTYEAHQDHALAWWLTQPKPRPANARFRVAFLTRSAERAENIASLAHDLAPNKDRLLCYAVTLGDYLSEPDALRSPVFLDHFGRWQALVNTHPSSTFSRTPVRLAPV